MQSARPCEAANVLSLAQHLHFNQLPTIGSNYSLDSCLLTEFDLQVADAESI